MRVNFVGSLGWELHHPIEYQNHLYDALIQAGAAHGLGHVGLRAMDSMRLEKSYRMWGTDLNAENTALEAGLDRFVRLNKAAFTGREALIRQQQAGIPNTFCTIEIDADDADPFGNEPIFMNGEVVGRGTAGGYGHYVKKSLMLGYVRTDAARSAGNARCACWISSGRRGSSRRARMIRRMRRCGGDILEQLEFSEFFTEDAMSQFQHGLRKPIAETFCKFNKNASD